MMTLASRSELKRHAFSSSSRSRPLKDSIQAFVEEEHFQVGIAVWRTRVDEQRCGAVESAPVVDGMCDELRTVVEAHVGRRSALPGEPIQDGDDAVGVDAATNFDGQ